MPPPLPGSAGAGRARFVAWFFGPELFWLLVFVAMHVVAGRNQLPTEQGSGAIETWWWLLAFVAVPLTFASFAVPGVGRWWLLLRVDLAALAGLFLAGDRLMRASGFGGVVYWFELVFFGGMILGAASILTALVLWLRPK